MIVVIKDGKWPDSQGVSVYWPALPESGGPLHYTTSLTCGRHTQQQTTLWAFLTTTSTTKQTPHSLDTTTVAMVTREPREKSIRARIQQSQCRLHTTGRYWPARCIIREKLQIPEIYNAQFEDLRLLI